jgi:hypothetical protein
MLKFIWLKFDNSRILDLITMIAVKLKKRTGSLEYLMLNAIDDALKQIFKEDGAKVIYDYLQNRSDLKLEKISEKPEGFSASLEELLVSGAPVVENQILRNMYRELELKFEEKKGYEFPDYIKELKKSAIV